MNIYENLDKIHDAVVNWDDDYGVECTSECSDVPMTPTAHTSNPNEISNIVTIGNRSYYISNSGHLWPI